MSKTALIMAGGTGGHVFPALATADVLRAQGVEVHWMGTERGIESRVIPEAGIPLHTIDVQGVRGKGKLGLLAAPFRIFKAIRQAKKVFNTVKPDVVMGMGGFASGPGAVAAKLSGVPLVIHEQNATAGMTNRLSARFASRVLEAFGGAFGEGVLSETVGNPVRGDILDLPEPSARFKDRTGPLRILVVGGSLGAKAINELMPKALAELSPDERPEVWHQTGMKNLEETQAIYDELSVSAKVVPFIEKMSDAYGWADWVVCRSGALTVSELAIAGVPALLVPFPFAVDDHQTTNAEFLVNAGAARLIQQRDLGVDDVVSLMKNESDRAELVRMADQGRSVARPQASQHVAEICLEMMK
jgi:UDP-N-acetylglucosamine--N-acetylmuramyl-(pentapeptide) pyrophosphoryl-undecaprenol N-acetylglucosamine transferase